MEYRTWTANRKLTLLSVVTITRAARLASIARTLDASQSSIPWSGLVVTRDTPLPQGPADCAPSRPGGDAVHAAIRYGDVVGL